ncbi:MAG: tetraacyldisaccharide 4'-kinase [bacterium]
MKKILSKIFKIAVDRRNKNFDSGKAKIHKCVSPVISVGNLSIGGSGKTPFVLTLTKMIKELGFHPAIVGRGYKRKSKGEVIVCDGNSILTDAKTGGDEMLLLAESLNVPVLAHDMKYIGALRTESMFDIDCIIVDDGYQHRQLFRDLDILLMDSDTVSNPYLIPKGRLREPLESIQRADIIGLIGNIDINNHQIEKFIENKLLLNLKVVHGEQYLISDNKLKDSPILSSNIKNIITVCGIAKPKNFRIMLEAMGYKLVEKIVYDDHHYYKNSDIEYILNKCRKANINCLATTEKDAVKLKEFGNIFASNNIYLLVFPIFIKIVEGENELKEILKGKIRKNHDKK